MIATKVLSDMKARIEQTGARVEVKDLTVLNANPGQMQQLFYNIIDNAFKFSKKNEPPVITIKGEHIQKNENNPDDGSGESGLYQITVEDNGIGFDEKYAQRIFRVFQRLHARDEYSGTGIGLSVCKRIAERHGGSISAESSPGQGAKFVVTIPVNNLKEHSE